MGLFLRGNVSCVLVSMFRILESNATYLCFSVKKNESEVTDEAAVKCALVLAVDIFLLSDLKRSECE